MCFNACLFYLRRARIALSNRRTQQWIFYAVLALCTMHIQSQCSIPSSKHHCAALWSCSVKPNSLLICHRFVDWDYNLSEFIVYARHIDNAPQLCNDCMIVLLKMYMKRSKKKFVDHFRCAWNSRGTHRNSVSIAHRYVITELRI